MGEYLKEGIWIIRSDGWLHTLTLQHKLYKFDAFFAMGVIGEPIVEILSASTPSMLHSFCVLHANVRDLRVENGPRSGKGKVVFFDKDVITSHDHTFVLI